MILLLVVGDHASTYYCLTTPSDGYSVTELNPLSRRLFKEIGLVRGLVLEAIIKGILMIPLYKLAQRNESNRRITLQGATVVVLIMAFVNYNNWSIYLALVN